MSMGDGRIKITVAIIGLFSAVAVAVIGNWAQLFPGGPRIGGA